MLFNFSCRFHLSNGCTMRQMRWHHWDNFLLSSYESPFASLAPWSILAIFQTGLGTSLIPESPNQSANHHLLAAKYSASKTEVHNHLMLELLFWGWLETPSHQRFPIWRRHSTCRSSTFYHLMQLHNFYHLCWSLSRHPTYRGSCRPSSHLSGQRYLYIGLFTRIWRRCHWSN